METENEIMEVLQMDPENIPENEPLDPADSPLNYPVKEKDIAGGGSFQSQPPPDDAPEQKVGEAPSEEKAFEVPEEQALMMADMVFGAANNIIAVGGGFFVKIKKHGEFQQYEELIQVIDEQNEKNVRRLLLDEEDKAMLRPLLVAVLKKRAKILSPEEQLAIAAFSILIKKAQVVMEIRSENKQMEERILSIVKQYGSPQEPQAETKAEDAPQTAPEPAAQVVEEVEPEEIPQPKNGPGVVRTGTFSNKENPSEKRLDSKTTKKPAT